MFSMIEGVLNYSVVNTTEQQIEPVDLNETLDSIKNDLELLVEQKKATIHCPDLPKIEGSAVLLYQLFYNLVNNSLKFSKPDQPSVIRISSLVSEDSGEWATIKVEDNGIGFAQEHAERIFESFARLNSKDQFEGTGLGLSLCRRIAERHGGSIHATGEPGVGASFSVRLPLVQTRKSI
ncbi:MAG TPA: ATP-binding protein, partial [Flavisolibacter sp.]